MNNQCTFVGRVGADPTTKIFTDTKNKVVKFSLAVKDFSPNRDEVRTTWISVDAWNGLGDRVLQTVAKGREIVINGRLSTTTYKTEKDGVMHEITKPVLNLTSFHLCGKKPMGVATSLVTTNPLVEAG
jgi:single-strand DNA-binding protein